MNVLVHATQEPKDSNVNDYELTANETINSHFVNDDGTKRKRAQYQPMKNETSETTKYQKKSRLINKNWQQIHNEEKAEDKPSLASVPIHYKYVIFTYLTMSDERSYLHINKATYNLLRGLYRAEYLLFFRQYFYWIRNIIDTSLYYPITEVVEFTKYKYYMKPEERRAVYQEVFRYCPPEHTNEDIQVFVNHCPDHQIIFRTSKSYSPDDDVDPHFCYTGEYPEGIDLRSHILYDGWSHQWLASCMMYDVDDDYTADEEPLFSFWSALPLVFTTHQHPEQDIHIPSYEVNEMILFRKDEGRNFVFCFNFKNKDAFYKSIDIKVNLTEKQTDDDTYWEPKTTIKCYKDPRNNRDNICDELQFIQVDKTNDIGIYNICKYKLVI